MSAAEKRCPEGRGSLRKKSGQQLLDGFISELALDLPKFMGMNDREKAKVLLEVIGIGDKLTEPCHKVVRKTAAQIR